MLISKFQTSKDYDQECWPDGTQSCEKETISEHRGIAAVRGTLHTDGRGHTHGEASENAHFLDGSLFSKHL